MSSKPPTKHDKKGKSAKPVKGPQKPPIEQPTPIIITGGSPLHAISEVVAWGDWTPVDPHKLKHPLEARKITRVLFKDDNNPAVPAIQLPVPANGKCTVTVVYEL